MTRSFRHALIATAGLAVLGAVAACGGGGGGGQSGLPGGSGSATANFTIAIPGGATSSSTQRGAAFISPNTQSATISINGALTTANLTPSSPNCTLTGPATGTTIVGGTPTSNGLTCTVSVDAPAGSDTFVVTLYSGLNGAGSVLSSSTVTATVSATQATTIPVVLGGVVASVAVTVVNGNDMVPGGFPTTLPVNVVAKDPSGATIVGPAPYANPITLTNADTSGITVLSTTNVTSPATAVTLAYAPTDTNGGVLDLAGLPLGATKIGASATGVPVAAITAGTFQYIADRFFGLGHTRTLAGTATVVETPYSMTGLPGAPTTYTYTISDALTNHTGLTFNGVQVNETNHVLAYTQTSPVTAVPPETETQNDYRSATASASGAILYRQGEQFVDVNSGAANSPATGFVPGTTTEIYTFPATGGWEEDTLPHVAGTTWSDTNVPRTIVDTGAQVSTRSFLADGSWTFNQTSPTTITQNQTAAGTGTSNVNGTAETVSVPSAGTIPVSQQIGVAAPTAMTPTDWYPNGGVLTPPLYATTYVLSQAAIPGACNVPAAIATQAYVVTQVNNDLNVVGFQTIQQTWTDYYVPNGIGFVCEIYTDTDTAYRYTTGIISNQYVQTYTLGVQSVGALSGRRVQ